MLPEVVVAFVDQRAPTFVKSRGERPAGAWIKIELRMTVKNLMKYLDYTGHAASTSRTGEAQIHLTCVAGDESIVPPRPQMGSEGKRHGEIGDEKSERDDADSWHIPMSKVGEPTRKRKTPFAKRPVVIFSHFPTPANAPTYTPPP